MRKQIYFIAVIALLISGFTATNIVLNIASFAVASVLSFRMSNN